MGIITIVLAVAFFAEAVINVYFYITVQNAKDSARSYKTQYDKLLTECHSHILDNARLEQENSDLQEHIAELETSDTEKTMLIAALERELAEYENMTVTAEPTGAGAYDETGSVPWTIDRLPEGLTNTYRCMDYRKITDKNSAQIILQEDTCTSTESSTGLRFSMIDGERYYHAALATAYGIGIGNAFRVTLDNGYVFNILHAEYKHAIDDPRKDDFGDPDVNYRGEPTTSVIEFVYDWKSAPQEVIGRGGMFIEPFTDGVDNTNGNIVKIEYLGRKWRV